MAAKACGARFLGRYVVLLSGLAVVLLSGAGCFAHVKPDLVQGSDISPAGLVEGRPTIAVDVACDWAPSLLPKEPNEIGQVMVMIDPGVPVFIGGTKYVAPPDYAREAFRKLLEQELGAVGFDVVAAADDPDELLRVKLVHGKYLWTCFVLFIFPMWNEDSRGLILSSEANLQTPAATYERKFKVVHTNKSVPLSRRFAEAWRQHASAIAVAVAEQYRREDDGGRE